MPAARPRWLQPTQTRPVEWQVPPPISEAFSSTSVFSPKVRAANAVARPERPEPSTIKSWSQSTAETSVLQSAFMFSDLTSGA